MRDAALIYFMEHVSDRNTVPDITNTIDVINVTENSALGMSLWQFSASDNENDVLTFHMTIVQSEGYKLFELSSSKLFWKLVLKRQTD